MENVKVLIVEDQMVIATALATLLRKHNLEVASICRSAEEALKQFDRTKPDLILMDIKLQGEVDGITVAEMIKQMSDVPIIYLTDFSDRETFERAKKTFPDNYLTKPFNKDDVLRAVDMAFTNHQAKEKANSSQYLKDFIFVRTANLEFLKVAYADIILLKAERAYCQIILEDRTLTLSTSMNHIQEQLDHPDFFKAHRSYVINLNKISRIEGRVVHLGKHEVQMNEKSYRQLVSHLRLVK